MQRGVEALAGDAATTVGVPPDRRLIRLRFCCKIGNAAGRRAGAGMGRMADNRRRLRAGLAALVAFSLIVCPLGWAGSRGAPARAAGRGQIDFTPDVLLLQVTPTPAGIPITPVVSPTSPFPAAVVVIGGQPFPFCEGFSDASGIPIGPTETDYTEQYGYAAVVGQPNMVLMWIPGASGRLYMLARADDPNFSGPMGFTHYLSALRESEEATQDQFGEAALPVFGLAGIFLAGCLESAGVGCIVATGLAIGGLLYGGLSTAGVMLTRFLPAVIDALDAFYFLDLHCP